MASQARSKLAQQLEVPTRAALTWTSQLHSLSESLLHAESPDGWDGEIRARLGVNFALILQLSLPDRSNQA